ncbi:hypothetical protein SHKM778_80360 [Streptomyces sp. KM77-8]|uniref:D-inositol 3-phosphate glycosyltransferase n=1 Tax=Streptomyces haneummycinicus TaxID=3074435 RepID=A0AAT9HWK7_9ACTN
MPNGVDLDRFRFDAERRELTRRRLGLPEGAYVVGGIGRLTRGKRFDVLVRALALLPEDHWLLVVGGGPEEHLLRRTAHEAGVAGRVLFTGERPGVPDGTPGPDLPSLTAAMDLFASPSPEEAFGLAAVEALAAGLPVLYASCPAIEDLPHPTAPAPAGCAADRRRTPARSPRPVRPVPHRARPAGPRGTTASPAVRPASWTCTRRP